MFVYRIFEKFLQACPNGMVLYLHSSVVLQMRRMGDHSTSIAGHMVQMDDNAPWIIYDHNATEVIPVHESVEYSKRKHEKMSVKTTIFSALHEATALLRDPATLDSRLHAAELLSEVARKLISAERQEQARPGVSETLARIEQMEKELADLKKGLRDAP